MTINEKKEILRNACIEAIGREFCKSHKDGICKAFGEGDNGLYCFYGISLTRPNSNRMELTHENNWDVYAIAEFDDNGNPYIYEIKI